MKMNSMELLAPAGSFEALVAACESGADAVYLGGQRYSARASANNFDDDQLESAVKYAHIRGVKVYVTMNTLVLDIEIPEVMEYIDFLYKLDVDALILQDIGLAKLIKQRYSDFEIHGSTQMTVHDLDGAMLLKEIGFSRVVPARELSSQEIKKLSIDSGLKIEIFIHGALCVSWSGQCLLSSLIGGRSGNRGRCAQPCRRKYKRFGEGFPESKATYALSTKDLNTIEDIESIVNSGASALKIEGRMKSPEYVGITVFNYRKALDHLISEESNDDLENAQYELKASFNREFTKGYILGDKGKEIISEERPDNRGIFLGRVISQKGNFLRIKLEENFVQDGDGIEIEGPDGNSGIMISGINVNGQPGKIGKKGDTVEVYTGRTFEVGSEVRKTLDSELQKKAQDNYMHKNRKKIHLTGFMYLNVGEKCVFTIEDDQGNISIAETKDIISEATNKAAKLESVRTNLEKTGDTPFIFDGIKAEISGNCFLPASVVNELRRNAISDMEVKRSILHPDRIVGERPAYMFVEKSKLEKCNNEKIICRVENLDQAITCIEAGVTFIDIKWDSFCRDNSGDKLDKLNSLKEKGAAEIWAVLPNIIKDSEKKFLKELLILCQNDILLGVVANGIGMVHWARENKVPFRAGSSLNVFNREALGFYADSIGIQPSEELNLNQILELGKYNGNLECKAYGRTVVMTMEYCAFEAEGCNSNCGVLKGASLDDNTGRAFPLRRSIGHRVQLLNSSYMLIYKEFDNFVEKGICKFILDFNDEDIDFIKDTVQGFFNLDLRKSGEYPELIQENIEKGNVEYTKGHYFRGVI